jgi:hypothetical protein
MTFVERCTNHHCSERHHHKNFLIQINIQINNYMSHRDVILTTESGAFGNVTARGAARSREVLLKILGYSHPALTPIRSFNCHSVNESFCEVRIQFTTAGLKYGHIYLSQDDSVPPDLTDSIHCLGRHLYSLLAVSSIQVLYK